MGNAGFAKISAADFCLLCFYIQLIFIRPQAEKMTWRVCCVCWAERLQCTDGLSQPGGEREGAVGTLGGQSHLRDKSSNDQCRQGIPGSERKWRVGFLSPPSFPLAEIRVIRGEGRGSRGLVDGPRSTLILVWDQEVVGCIGIWLSAEKKTDPD